jgi:prolyl oligopeptidase
MPALTLVPPPSLVETVTEILHGTEVNDPYRWLEDQDSPRTRDWIAQQTRYARTYLDRVAGRECIRERIRQLLAVKTYDSLRRVGNLNFFRKRLADEEQPSIYVRRGEDGEDRLLVDPAAEGPGKLTSVKLLRVSPDGRLVLYEVKEGGERTGTFRLIDVDTGAKLADALPRGILRGFVFAPDGESFYYSHEPLEAPRPFYRAAYRHVLGNSFAEDEEIFSAGEDRRLRLFLLGEDPHLGILVNKCFECTYTDFYLRPFDGSSPVLPLLADARYAFQPILANGHIFALTDRDAPNFRVVEVLARTGDEPHFVEIVPEQDARIAQWAVAGNRIFASYTKNGRTEIQEYDFGGRKTGEIPMGEAETARLVGPLHAEELTFEAESFTEPVGICRYSPLDGERKLWARKTVPFDSANYTYRRVSYSSKDGTQIPMFLMGRRDTLDSGTQPTIMTSYGGFGASVTPQFSVFVAYLVEHGCLFALPSIRGGAEFGAEWHNQAKRRNRQTAYDDFLCAAEWLFASGRTTPGTLAIFGGSNSGLLVGAALTQRPDLFRAAVVIAPLMDMLRYHLFDQSHVWKDEFGTAEDAEDFAALAGYSPYHRVREGQAYPAAMIVSGDADTNCNPLHARKMTARLQAATSSAYPVILDYSKFRGHSPVLPLSERIEALTDRMAFLSDQLKLPL